MVPASYSNDDKLYCNTVKPVNSVRLCAFVSDIRDLQRAAGDGLRLFLFYFHLETWLSSHS